MTEKSAVVLLSGGIDSSTTLAIAKSRKYSVYALTFNYRQRHDRELESARMVASALGVRRHLVIGFDLAEIGGSALTSDMEVPKNRSREMEFGKRNETEMEGSLSTLNSQLSAIPVTYVPARNTIFLSFALAWAEVLSAEHIFIGANAIDYSGYPDCRPEYLKAFEEMANLATRASVEGRMKFKILAPLLYLKKSDIIKKGAELGLDYALTWSCYDPQPAAAGVQSSKSIVQSHKEENSEPGTPNFGTVVPCGRCDSCLFRAKGFHEAGIEDPLIVRG
ncbi:MAG: 7-cyano-7-deazaguanine synthase QueC [Nitrospirota bacterium]